MTWLNRWRRWRRARLLKRVMVPAPVWHRVVERSLARHRLSVAELTRLRELASLFLHEKAISGVDLVPNDTQRVTIAALACLLILELELSYYDGWYEIVLYPDTFVVRHDQLDETGVVHQNVAALGGESWQRGPVILSWSNIVAGELGYNVILHEFAHKLDMANGSANGMPPLHVHSTRLPGPEPFSRHLIDCGIMLRIITAPGSTPTVPRARPSFLRSSARRSLKPLTSYGRLIRRCTTSCDSSIVRTRSPGSSNPTSPMKHQSNHTDTRPARTRARHQ